MFSNHTKRSHAAKRLRSRLTERLEKVQKNVCAPYYMATPEEKQIDTHLKLNDQCISQRTFRVNPVVINYKIQHNKNRLAMSKQGIVLCGQTAFSIIICGGRKTQSGHVRLRARVAMEEGLLIVHVN